MTQQFYQATPTDLLNESNTTQYKDILQAKPRQLYLHMVLLLQLITTKSPTVLSCIKLKSIKRLTM